MRKSVSKISHNNPELGIIVIIEPEQSPWTAPHHSCQMSADQPLTAGVTFVCFYVFTVSEKDTKQNKQKKNNKDTQNKQEVTSDHNTKCIFHAGCIPVGLPLSSPAC